MNIVHKKTTQGHFSDQIVLTMSQNPCIVNILCLLVWWNILKHKKTSFLDCTCPGRHVWDFTDVKSASAASVSHLASLHIFHLLQWLLQINNRLPHNLPPSSPFFRLSINQFLFPEGETACGKSQISAWVYFSFQAQARKCNTCHCSVFLWSVSVRERVKNNWFVDVIIITVGRGIEPSLCNVCVLHQSRPVQKPEATFYFLSLSGDNDYLCHNIVIT